VNIDVNYSHSKNVGEQVGNFCDVPILAMDMFELDVDVALDSQRTVLINKAMGCSETPNTAEVLPGETICPDNIIRRTTTAEAIDYDKYMERKPVAMIVGAGRMVYDPNNNQWGRPDGVVGQSTPEQLMEWLNALQKRSFKSHVEVDGEDKIFVTEDAKGQTVYAFRYFDSVAGTYIGGDEIRLLERPQTKVNEHTTTRVLQYKDNGNAIKAVTQPVEYADEFISHYNPTSHVDRITTGGTALFAPEVEQ